MPAMSLISNVMGHKISANASKYLADQSKSAAISSAWIHTLGQVASAAGSSIGKFKK